MNKLLSGRFILTVICGLVFAVTALNKIIPMDATVSILTMVFVAYFNRGDRNGKQNGEVK